MTRKDTLAILDSLQEHLSAAYEAVDQDRIEGVYVPLLAIRQISDRGVKRYNKKRENAA